MSSMKMANKHLKVHKYGHDKINKEWDRIHLDQSSFLLPPLVMIKSLSLPLPFPLSLSTRVFRVIRKYLAKLSVFV